MFNCYGYLPKEIEWRTVSETEERKMRTRGSVGFCTKCGNHLSDGDVFCGKCGAGQSFASTPVDLAETQVVSPPPQRKWDVTACSACGKEVSRTAKTCPHCGEKHPGLPSFIKTIVWGSIVVLFLWVAYSGSKSGSAPDSDSTAAESPAATAGSPAAGVESADAETPPLTRSERAAGLFAICTGTEEFLEDPSIGRNPLKTLLIATDRTSYRLSYVHATSSLSPGYVVAHLLYLYKYGKIVFSAGPTEDGWNEADCPRDVMGQRFHLPKGSVGKAFADDMP